MPSTLFHYHTARLVKETESMLLTCISSVLHLKSRGLSTKDNLEACLPFDYSEEEFRAKDYQIAIGSYISIFLIGLEVAAFMSAVSIFMPTSTIISIGAHASGAVALSYFIFDEWDCDLFWWVFAWCSVIPAAVELLNILGLYLFKKF